MARPTARVLALLEILQAGRTRTVGELSRRLGVDERTVRRYVAHLIDLEIPVRSVRGRHGGYRLAPGFRLPPLMFDDDEAVAVLLGLLAARRIVPSVTLPEPTESAAAKVRRVLPESLVRRVDALLDATSFTAPMVGADNAAQAPVRLCCRSPRPSDDRVRRFRLDRVAAPALRTGTFEVPADFDVGAHLVTGLAETPWHHDIRVRVQASADQVRRRLPTGLAVVAPSDETGWVDVRLRAERLDWVPALLAGLGHPFVVEQPAALREEVRALAQRLDRYAEDPPSPTED